MRPSAQVAFNLHYVISAGTEGVYIDIQVQPRARRPGVRGVHGDRLKIAVSEPPEDGRANAAAISAVADLLNVSNRTISLVSGKTSPQKRLFVKGMRSGTALDAITRAADSSNRKKARP